MKNIYINLHISVTQEILIDICKNYKIAHEAFFRCVKDRNNEILTFVIEESYKNNFIKYIKDKHGINYTTTNKRN